MTRGTRELLDKVEKMYKSWFIVWRDTVHIGPNDWVKREKKC